MVAHCAAAVCSLLQINVRAVFSMQEALPQLTAHSLLVPQLIMAVSLNVRQQLSQGHSFYLNHRSSAVLIVSPETPSPLISISRSLPVRPGRAAGQGRVLQATTHAHIHTHTTLQSARPTKSFTIALKLITPSLSPGMCTKGCT